MNNRPFSPWATTNDLTYDGEGFVYWKGIQVEHYDYPEDPKMFDAAYKLIERCRHIESLGLTPSTVKVIWRWDFYKDCPKDYSWEPIQGSIYSLSLCDNSAIAIYCLDETNSIGIYGRNGATELYRRHPREEYQTWYEVDDGFSRFFRIYPRHAWHSVHSFAGYDRFFREFNVPANLLEVISNTPPELAPLILG